VTDPVTKPNSTPVEPVPNGRLAVEGSKGTDAAGVAVLVSVGAIGTGAVSAWGS
jgi:hypothetical protein